MSSPERSPALLPDNLQPETMGTIPIDTPRFVSPQNIYVDDNNYAYVYPPERLPANADKPASMYGQVAIMLVMLGMELHHVADTRYTVAVDKASDESASPQDFNYWDQDYEGGAPVVAFMTRDPDTKEDIAIGDPEFFDAARHLAHLVDIARDELERDSPSSQEPYHFTWQERAFQIPLLRLRETFRRQG